MAVEPGSFTIEATKPGEKPVRREITVGAGETKTLALTFAAAAPPPKVEFRFTLEPAPDAAVPAKAVPSPVKKPARPAAGSGG